MLKVDLHIHAQEDKADSHIEYTARQLIDKAAAEQFDVLAFTFHHQFFWNSEIRSYAQRKKIMLIPGSEMIIEGKDVLVYNIHKEHLQTIKTFDDLREAKKKDKNIFVIAPHPYYPGSASLGEKLDQHNDVFDAIEFCWLHTSLLTFNTRAKKAAKNYNKPLIATSDSHYLEFFGNAYTLVHTKKADAKEIFTAIKSGKYERHSPKIGLISAIRVGMRIIIELITLQSKKNKYRNHLKEIRCRTQL